MISGRQLWLELFVLYLAVAVLFWVPFFLWLRWMYPP